MYKMISGFGEGKRRKGERGMAKRYQVMFGADVYV